MPSLLFGAEVAVTPRILALSDEHTGYAPVLVATAESGFISLWTELHVEGDVITQNAMYRRTDSFGSPLESIRELTHFPPRVGVATSTSPDLGELDTCADHEGNIYVLWDQHWSQPNEPRSVDEIVLAISHDSGESWNAPVNVSDDSRSSIPVIACGDEGTVLVAFFDFVQLGSSYRVSRDHGDSFQPLLPVPRGRDMATSSVRSAFSILADGTIVAAWEAGHVGDSTYDIFTAYSHDGETWSEPMDVSDDPDSSQDPVIASTDDGRTVIAWEGDGIVAKILDVGTGRLSRKPFRLSWKDPMNRYVSDPTIAYHHGIIWSIWSQGGDLPPTYGTARPAGRSEFERRRTRRIVEGWGGVISSAIGVSNDGAVGIVWTGCRTHYCGLAPTPAFLAIVKPPDLRRLR